MENENAYIYDPQVTAFLQAYAAMLADVTKHGAQAKSTGKTRPKIQCSMNWLNILSLISARVQRKAWLKNCEKRTTKDITKPPKKIQISQ